MKERWLQIGHEVVVLWYDEKDGKITPGPLRVVPIGVWNKLKERKDK